MATTTETGQGAFGQIFSDLFSTATNVLGEIGKVRAQGYIQNLEAENAVRVQETLTRTAASPTNNPVDANKAAQQNTVNLFGFLTVPKEQATLYGVGFGLVALLTAVLIFRLVRK